MKTNTRKSNRCHEGSAFITSLIIVFVVSLTAGSFYAFSSNSIYQSERLSDSIRAKAIAEAGVNEAIAILTEPGQYGMRHDADNFPETAFSGGTYAVNLENGTDDQDGRVLLTSVGTYGEAMATIGVDIRDRLRESIAGSEAGNPSWRDFAIFANGDMTYNGSPEIEGDCHTNNEWDLNGNWFDVNAMISAQNSEDIPEEFRRVWQLIPFPSLSDPEFQAFIAAYQAAGGTVTRINGDKTWHGDVTLNGITIVTGNVIFRAAGTRFITGMLYVTGSITANGSGTLTLEGSMLSGGDITFNGVAGVFTHAAIGDNEGGGTGQTAEELDANAQAEVFAMWQGDGR